MDGIHKFIPFGYRCSSAGILRKMGLKLESYPFDWMVSRLDALTDCINNGFDTFTNVNNYVQINTHTNHQAEDGSKTLIVNETIIYNKQYQPVLPSDPLESYQYNMAILHHNIFEVKMMDYFKRCIVRFKQLLVDKIKKIYLHISPVQWQSAHTAEREALLLKSFTDFHTNLLTHSVNISGLFFIPVRMTSCVVKSEETVDGSNSTQMNETVRLECIHNRKDIRVYVLYCNPDLIDAGEIFQGECEKEVALICQTVREKLIEETRDFLMGL